jgi:hypothetical protein
MAKRLTYREALRRLQERQEVRANGDCQGPCVGLGVVLKVVKGKCPDPCDAGILKKLQDEAKKRAKKEANEQCKKRVKQGKCACDGSYVPGPKACRNLTTDVEECTDVCVYYAEMIYVGECTKPEND